MAKNNVLLPRTIESRMRTSLVRGLYRRPGSNKGDYGHIFILAGSLGFTGAAVLTALAAMRTGAGLVTLGIPGSLNTIVAKRILEAMTKPLPETSQKTLSLAAYKQIIDFAKKADVLAIGPGLSRNLQTQKLIRKVISNTNIPLVIDADGLNALAGHLNILRTTPACRTGRQDAQRKTHNACLPDRQARRTTILTPHPGEFSRLIGKSVNYIQENRETLAKSFAREYNVVLVLKGHRTVVACAKNKSYVNKTGNPGMSTAGAGDVLTGMITALLGQGFNSFETARLGVYLHGLAGDLAAKEKTQAGLIASDIIEKIPEAIKKL